MGVRAGKAGWVGSGKPNAVHNATPRLKCSTAHQVFVRQRVPGERGQNVTEGRQVWTIASSAASGDVTFTFRAVSARVPWSDLTWNNKPGVTGPSVEVTITDPQPGDVVEFDAPALMQTALDERHYGWRISSDSDDVTRFYGFETEFGPELFVTATEKPAAATDLVPNGIGSLAKPFLQWTAPDYNGGDDQTGFRVQIANTAEPAEDSDGIWTAPVYDSGQVNDPAPELNLAATAYAGLADGGEFWWQVLWLSESGLWAPVSDTAHYAREVKPGWTFANPTGGEVDDTQPVFEATFGATLKAWRATLALASKPHKVISGSGKVRATSDTVTWQPMDMVYIVGQREPINLQDGEEYILTLDGWRDGDGYVASVGDPVQVRTEVTFTVNETTGVEAPVLVSVAQRAEMPVAELEVTRSTMPDSFTVFRDGVAVKSVDADEVHDTGTTYRIPDALATPMRQHSYQVRARDEGAGRSAKSNAMAATVNPEDAWLISRDLTSYVRITSSAPPSMQRTDEAGIFRVQGSDGEIDLVVIRAGTGKVEGTFAGNLFGDHGQTVDDAVADLDAMWKAGEPVHLVAANVSLLVVILDPVTVPHDHIHTGEPWTTVTGRFVEVSR